MKPTMLYLYTRIYTLKPIIIGHLVSLLTNGNDGTSGDDGNDDDVKSINLSYYATKTCNRQIKLK